MATTTYHYWLLVFEFELGFVEDGVLEWVYMGADRAQACARVNVYEWAWGALRVRPWFVVGWQWNGSTYLQPGRLGCVAPPAGSGVVEAGSGLPLWLQKELTIGGGLWGSG